MLMDRFALALPCLLVWLFACCAYSNTVCVYVRVVGAVWWVNLCAPKRNATEEKTLLLLCDIVFSLWMCWLVCCARCAQAVH